jgi:hypothetical protein
MVKDMFILIYHNNGLIYHNNGRLIIIFADTRKEDGLAIKLREKGQGFMTLNAELSVVKAVHRF